MTASNPAQTSPAEVIFATRMSFYQYAVVALCVLVYAADGVDVVTLAYAGPVMIAQWGISPEAFGAAYTATPVGIAVGSVFLSPLADRIGRRPMMIGILGALCALLLATAVVPSFAVLLVLRFLTGVLLGALVVLLNVTVAEFSDAKKSNLLVGILHTGYSLGSMICGGLAAVLIEPYGWRSIFFAAAALNSLSFVLACFIMLESPGYLVARRPNNALERLNAVFRRMGKPQFDALPPRPEQTGSQKRGAIPRAMWISTGLLCLAGFSFTVSGAFMAAFKPQILEMAGMDMTHIGLTGMTASAAGILAHISVGALARKAGERRIANIFLLATAAALIVLGLVPTGATAGLIAAAAVWGFFNVGSYTAIILVNLNHYQADLRNTGLGVMMGVARIGGIVGPLLGGFVIGAGFDRLTVLVLFAAVLAPPVLAVALLSFLSPKPEQTR
ncbi:MFS transporter [Novosphingobium aquimarinum]|uniref:MFS transporter n=1 Tax=Novosphingobium aquimarinum TaxID=2682494 RepID=UPI0012EC8A29|nr:MFS transporter [Novosphingobium aquimarinum]